MFFRISQTEDVKFAQLFVIAVTCLGEQHEVIVVLFPWRHDKPSQFCKFSYGRVLFSESWFCFCFYLGILSTAEDHVDW